jgi:hypothetical protein
MPLILTGARGNGRPVAMPRPKKKKHTPTAAAYEKAVTDLAAQGVWLTKRSRWGTGFAVRFCGAPPSTAYITDDLQNAIKQGRAMAKAGPPQPSRS